MRTLPVSVVNRLLATLAPVAIIALASSVGGCAHAPSGPGWLDARLADSAREGSAKEVELDLAAGGRVAKIAVEHRGAARVPEALRKLAEATYPGAAITEFEEELYDDGTRALEVEVKAADGRECELSMSEAGALRYTECQLKAADAPAAVQAALATAVPGTKLDDIKEIELRQGPAWNEYRVELKSGERTFYVRVRPDGTVLSRAVRLEAEVTIPLP